MPPRAARRSMGSPPRMRGKGISMTSFCAVERITPAYAGKSYAAATDAAKHEDHPRVCGEKFQRSKTRVIPLGSPPRMRGKGIQQGNARVTVRITPAYAGKSFAKRLPPCQLEDHPRVCGEKNGQERSAAPRPGSPPRMRGKAAHQLPGQIRHRITPAYAGKSML